MINVHCNLGIKNKFLNISEKITKITKFNYFYTPKKNLPSACRACSMFLHVILIECCWNESKRDLKNVSETSKVIAEIFLLLIGNVRVDLRWLTAFFLTVLYLLLIILVHCQRVRPHCLQFMQHFVNVDKAELEHE